MPAASRAQVDPSTGHGGFAPRSGASSGSGDVIINGSPALRVGDPWPSHTDGNSSHDGTQAAGSETVFVNGQPLARIGDATSDGDALAGGSPDVICG
jgi:uncharacterized Zn-binding protein involved in type VI secretion